MQYTVHELAKLSGVSDRTLRYYDSIDLLKPAAYAENGYRVYGPEQVDTLQQILFYRELGFRLEEIGEIINSPGFDRQKALSRQLEQLKNERDRVETLIANVIRTLSVLKGDNTMNDEQKFEGFKRELIEQNEQEYGAEVREKYGDKAADDANERVRNMSKGQFDSQASTEKEMFELLKIAMSKNDVYCDEALKACELHRRWICGYWGDEKYSKDAHRELAKLYAADERFSAYYDKALGKGGAEFLKNALLFYTSQPVG